MRPYYFEDDNVRIYLPWYYEPGEDNVSVQHELNRLAYDAAGTLLEGPRVEITDEMTEALWARKNRLS